MNYCIVRSGCEFCECRRVRLACSSSGVASWRRRCATTSSRSRCPRAPRASCARTSRLTSATSASGARSSARCSRPPAASAHDSLGRSTATSARSSSRPRCPPSSRRCVQHVYLFPANYYCFTFFSKLL